jgi:hypothetical protein
MFAYLGCVVMHLKSVKKHIKIRVSIARNKTSGYRRLRCQVQFDTHTIHTRHMLPAIEPPRTCKLWVKMGARLCVRMHMGHCLHTGVGPRTSLVRRSPRRTSPSSPNQHPTPQRWLRLESNDPASRFGLRHTLSCPRSCTWRRVRLHKTKMSVKIVRKYEISAEEDRVSCERIALSCARALAVVGYSCAVHARGT